MAKKDTNIFKWEPNSMIRNFRPSILSSEVCSFDSAQKLKELGIKQDSMFCYIEREHLIQQLDKDSPREILETEVILAASDYLHYMNLDNVMGIWSTFTTNTLGKMLPKKIKYEDEKLTFVSWFRNIWCCSYQLNEEGEFWTPIDVIEDIAEAEARSKMLIYLLKNGFYKLPEAENV